MGFLQFRVEREGRPGINIRVQVDILKAYIVQESFHSERFLFRRVIIPKSHYSEHFYPEGLLFQISDHNDPSE